MSWVVLSVAAASFQLVRNALARQLAGSISPLLTSWSRFAFNLPFSLLLVGALVAWRGVPQLSPLFFVWCLGTGVAQLLGNVALVAAFQRSSFSQSIALHKLDVVLGAVLGVALFGEFPSAWGWAGVLVSTFGVLLMNLAGEGGPAGWRRAFHVDTGALLALACAALLALTSFLLKEAALEFVALNPRVGGDRFEAAAHTLLHVTWIEVAVLSVAIRLSEPGAFARVRALWPRMLAVGAAGFSGSLCWFWAYAIALVAYVRAVGQIEAVLGVLISLYWFREAGVRRQIPGIAVVTAGICMVLLG
ncbi:MAG: hypothetical protein QNK03_13785 [Myxococcota bacterium]|nr:hypothetical protein [Myxococcota bacterium]